MKIVEEVLTYFGWFFLTVYFNIFCHFFFKLDWNNLNDKLNIIIKKSWTINKEEFDFCS